MASELADLRSRGGDVERLRALALTDRAALAGSLKELGFAKMGQRLRVERALTDQPEGEGVTPQASAPPAEAQSLWESISAQSKAATSMGSLEESFAVSTGSGPSRPSASEPQRGPETDRNVLAASASSGGEPRSHHPVETRRAAEVQQEAGSTTPRSVASDGGPSEPPSRAAAASEDTKADIYRQRGNVAFARHDLVAAERWYGRAIDIEPGNVHVLNNLAACCLSAKPARPAEAMGWLRSLLRADPSNVKGGLRAGRACLLLGELREAEASFEAVGSRLRAARPCAEPRYAPPPAAAGSGSSSGASRLCGDPTPEAEAASRAAEGAKEARRLLEHATRCLPLARAGRTDEALYLARAVTRCCTHSALGPRRVVAVLEAAGRLGEAERECAEARRRFEHDGELAVAAARLHCARGGDADGAEALLEAVARARPEESGGVAAALQGLREARRAKAAGNAAYAAAQHEEAAALYSRGIEADAARCLSSQLLANRALARLRAGRPREALLDCDEALALAAEGGAEPTRLKLLLRRAECHVELRQLQSARRDYEAILSHDADCAAAREGLQRCGSGGVGGGGGGGGDGAGGGDGGCEAAEDPYEVLGVARDASAAQIKQAYHKAALRCHPDKIQGSDEEKAAAEHAFKRISLAHALLSDPAQRRLHDAGAQGLSGGRRAPAYAG